MALDTSNRARLPAAAGPPRYAALSRRHRLRSLSSWLLLLSTLTSLLSGCYETDSQAVDVQSEPSPEYKVFAMNRRGMAFPDADFSVSAIFPPANFLVAEVIKRNPGPGGMPTLLDAGDIELHYSALADGNASIDSTSSTKTNFWNYADAVYHFYSAGQYILAPDEGFHGADTEAQRMPGLSNAPQLFTRFDESTKTFTAPYIPITPLDDSGTKNYFPLFEVEAVDKATRRVLAATRVPLPMAEPMQCELCHATGRVAADAQTSQRFGGLVWSNNSDSANNAKENIAILHTVEAGLNLTVRQPYLCAECHYSPIADPDGRGPTGDYQTRRNPLSISIHAWHALDRERRLPDGQTQALIPEDGEASCKICHGGIQPYTRGPMHDQGIVCQDCHGGLMSVGKSPLVGALDTRKPFADEPRCESCHTGDEVSHIGEDLVLRKAFEEDDPFATPRIAANRRFAEQPGTLYRASVGHGGATCISCHGSPHAEWPVLGDATHDNDIAIGLQGHAGSIIECSACHADGLQLTMDGPHGLHNIDDDDWVTGHGEFFDALGSESCQACHGADLLGGRLSNAAQARTFTLPDGRPIFYEKGEAVGCVDCHALPLAR